MGRNHLRTIQQGTSASLIGVVDADEARLAAIKDFAVKRFRTVKDALDTEVFEAAVIVTPTTTHAEIAEQCLERGLHVFIEKPLAATAKDAARIVGLAAEYGKKVAVGHIERHNSALRLLRGWLAANPSEVPLGFAARRLSPRPARIQDVGVLADLASHDLDAILSLTRARVISVTCLTKPGSAPSLAPESHMTLEFSDGATASIESGWLGSAKLRRLEVSTNGALFECDFLNPRAVVTMPAASDGSSERERRELQPPRRDALTDELEDFFGAIGSSRDPLVSGADGLRVVRLIEAAIQSATARRTVEGSW